MIGLQRLLFSKELNLDKMGTRKLKIDEKLLLQNIDLTKFDLYDCEEDGLFSLVKTNKNIECPWCQSKEVSKIDDAKKAQDKLKEQEDGKNIS